MGRVKCQTNIRWVLMLTVLICTIMWIAPNVSAFETLGSCGEGLTWTYSAGTLSIAGQGVMEDYSEDSPAPWHELRDQITWVEFPQGLISVGNYAFSECDLLCGLVLPDSIVQIGEKAFFGCSGIKIVHWGTGLKSIGRSAFERCWLMHNLALPDGVESIDDQAFWRCQGLRTVSVPNSVTYFGEAVFAYCDSLIQADLQVSSEIVSKWTFFGCIQLKTVNLSSMVKSIGYNAFEGCTELSLVRFPGDRETAEIIGSDIQSHLEHFEPINVLYSQSDSSSSSNSWESGGKTHIQTDVIDKTDGNIIEISKVVSGILSESEGGMGNKFAEDEVQITINAVIQDEAGWDGLVKTLNSQIDKNSIQHDLEVNPVYVQVFILGQNSISGSQMADLVGKNIVLTLETISGNSWTVDCTKMSKDDLQDIYDLRYILLDTEIDEPKADLWYALQFSSAAQIDAEIMILLPGRPLRKNVSLYQKYNSKMVHVQTTKVDDDGYAHFYLGAVDNITEYYIGVEVDEQYDTSPIIPDNLTEEFDITDTLAPMDYVITGRKSSWGMEIGQVTWIMAGVLVGSVAVIGVVLFLLNKRKLKKGYVVDLDEYEIN